MLHTHTECQRTDGAFSANPVSRKCSPLQGRGPDGKGRGAVLCVSIGQNGRLPQPMKTRKRHTLSLFPSHPCVIHPLPPLSKSLPLNHHHTQKRVREWSDQNKTGVAFCSVTSLLCQVGDVRMLMLMPPRAFLPQPSLLTHASYTTPLSVVPKCVCLLR